jgi:diguanylate cyclase (GGDEF)-like protein
MRIKGVILAIGHHPCETLIGNAKGFQSLTIFDKRITYPLLVPTALIVFSALVVWKWPGLMKQFHGVVELRGLLMALPLLPYAFFAIGAILGWRFNNAGLILTSLALGLAYLALPDGAVHRSARSITRISFHEASTVLLPLNLGFFATMRRRRLQTPLGLSCIGLVLLQAFLLLLFCQSSGSASSQLALKLKASWPTLYHGITDDSWRLKAWLHEEAFLGYRNISVFGVLSFAAAFVFLFARFRRGGDALSAGYLGSLVAAFLGVSGGHSAPSPMIYFSAAGLVLLISAIESSFSMAYLDELTGLLGRRSLNEELVNLGRKFVIAMIDIDHFKKFNDQYGHKTGDQVLKMVASKLKDITGGAKVFRYGGEEFTAIFPGKEVEEALPHLDVYRRIIESTPFAIRGKDRRRKSAKNRAEGTSKGQKSVTVTVSIGAAAPGKDLTSPEKVLKQADKVLYKAKKAGRNRVET